MCITLQKRRRQGASYEGPSLADEEESETSQKYNDDFAVSQSDLPPEESVEEEDEEEEYVVKEKSEQNYSSSSVPDVEATDMEDFSSSCVPDQAEMSSNGVRFANPFKFAQVVYLIDVHSKY